MILPVTMPHRAHGLLAIHEGLRHCMLALLVNAKIEQGDRANIYKTHAKDIQSGLLIAAIKIAAITAHVGDLVSHPRVNVSCTTCPCLNCMRRTSSVCGLLQMQYQEQSHAPETTCMQGASVIRQLQHLQC